MSTNVVGDLEVENSVLDKEINTKIKYVLSILGIEKNLLSVKKLETKR